jgi:hypothetical protein
MRHNTTGHLVHDMERLGEHLSIGRWLPTAGSWGTTLALVYGERHPQRVLSPSAPHGDRNSTGSTAASAGSSPRNGNGSETGPEPIGTTISIRRGES